uniref:RHS repeat domain-containing protein n=1 Tax=Romboutsia lituseburensis TaxID=1537 RepID=UPI0022EB9585
TDKIYYTYDSENKLVSIELNGVEYYYVRNAQGDIISLIDSSGDEVVSYTYDTWGRLLSIDGKLKDSLGVKNPYRYRGYRYDNETEFYYLQSRYYNPEWGRFLNADSLVGETGELLSHNMFAYCSNDPVNNEDPDGDIAWWIGAAVGGAAFGAAEYLLTHRRGGATWKGLGKAAAGGAISGVLFGGAWKVASKGIRVLKAAKVVKKATKVTRHSASNIARGPKLNAHLTRKEATSIFTKSGKLKPSVVKDSVRLIPGSKLTNEAVKAALTKDGSKIGDWYKMSTKAYKCPSGKFEVHFYQNIKTGKISSYGFKSKISR